MFKMVNILCLLYQRNLNSSIMNLFGYYYKFIKTICIDIERYPEYIDKWKKQNLK